MGRRLLATLCLALLVAVSMATGRELILCLAPGHAAIEDGARGGHCAGGRTSDTAAASPRDALASAPAHCLDLPLAPASLHATTVGRVFPELVSLGLASATPTLATAPARALAAPGLATPAPVSPRPELLRAVVLLV